MTTKTDHDLLVEIHANCLGCSKMLCRHDKTLYGNDSGGGLVSKIRLLMWIISVASAISVVALGEWVAAKMHGG